MKSIAFTILFFTSLFLSNTYGQTSIGVGLARADGAFGPMVSSLHLKGDIGFSPRATYFFLSGPDVLRLDGDIQFGLFDIAEVATVYPLTGLTYLRSMGGSEGARRYITGINLGLGFRKTDGTSYFEGRLTRFNNCPDCELGYEIAYGYRFPLSR